MIDLTAVDPISQPLAYPGTPAPNSGVLTSDAFLPSTAENGRSLDRVLAGLGKIPLAKRHPVVAVGSNASIEQLRRKFLGRPVDGTIPMLLMAVTGITAGVSAHVSKPGYVPAAPLSIPGNQQDLFVLWLDEAQIVVLDETEPNYRRTKISSQRFPVHHESTGILQECSVYVSKHGCLTDAEGAPLLLTPQPKLLQRLLAEVPGLRALAGDTPESFVLAMQTDPNLREQVRALFQTEGLVLGQPDWEASQ